MDLSNQYRQRHLQPQQPYDPCQTYDQSTQAYYAFHQYNQYLQQQQYPYRTHDYSNAYYQHPEQFQQQEPTSIHPPGVPVAPEPAIAVGTQQGLGQTLVQNAYYPLAVSDQQLQQQVQRQQIRQSQYRGGGARGGRPFRGGGPGHLRGRGRGRGRGGHFPAPTDNQATFVLEESSQTTGHPVQGPFAAPVVWPPPRMAWCELCRVDCNTTEILEQHKNGKKHKKNLQVYEELQRLNSLLVGGQNEKMPVAVSIQPDKVEGSEDKQLSRENLASQAVTDENKVESLETNQQKGSEEAESREEPARKPGMDHVEGRGGGFKRKIRGGRGAKWMRTNEGMRRPIEPPKPKQVPLICGLCNVKCDTQVVFDTHLMGKKHLSNLKRFQNQQARVGQSTLQALYPALQALYPALQALSPHNPNFSISLDPQFRHEGVHGSHELLSQLASFLFPPGQASAPGHGSTSASAQPSVLENRDHQPPQPELPQDALPACIPDAATLETKSQR